MGLAASLMHDWKLLQIYCIELLAERFIIIGPVGKCNLRNRCVFSEFQRAFQWSETQIKVMIKRKNTMKSQASGEKHIKLQYKKRQMD
jgi:hypothetical protein